MKLFHRILAAAAFLSASFAISGAAAADNAPADPSQHSVSRHYDPLPPSPRPIQLFAYERDNRLYYAWKADGLEWHEIDHGWVSSDYGSWFAEKKMHDPNLFRDEANGMWYCVFTPNPDDPVFALTSSPDLVHWHVQNYYPMEKAPRGFAPCIYFDSGKYYIEWFDETNHRQHEEALSTQDFKHFSHVEFPHAHLKYTPIVKLGDREWKGKIVTISKAELDGILAAKAEADRKGEQNRERITDLPDSLKDVSRTAEISVDLRRTKNISPLLWGIFFEDINYSADGGLYAELVRNRDFEFNDLDHGGWNALTGWNVPKELNPTIATEVPIHPNNPHYLVLDAPESNNAALVNEGFRGMVFREGETYLLSIFAKCPDGGETGLFVSLLGEHNEIIGVQSFEVKGKEWTKTELKFTAKSSTDRGKLALRPIGGKLALDMVSLFPEKTFKGRRNGLRADLAQTLADLKPRFIRFPGGCVAHGNGLGNMYRWNRTVGPLEARVPQSNIWDYHQSAGLGYFEYFQFCEDIGAEPLPILPAGVSCQNSFRDGKGQQGIPMDEMGAYIQEVLDLIEWANGPADSKWGKVRAEAGHPEPFNLKYIGIGNEDLISEVFAERFVMIFDAVRAKHPEITVVGTVGPTYEGSDYEDGWALARKHNVPIVDEHYYQSPGWFLNNQHFYDTYVRGGTRVYLGEYASHNGPRTSTIETALTEAIHMISLERNGDVVAMASYAPLLAKEGDTQWNPDMIYFNNTQVKPTTGYYVQKLFGNNAGDKYARTVANLLNNDGRALPDNNRNAPLLKRFASSCVIDTKTNTATVKIVNLLPFEMKTTLKLDNLVPSQVNATMTVLSGSPDQTNVRPAEPEDITLDSSTALRVKPFSLTVLSFPIK